ncbi:hypothetical protein [Kribbella italica]|uniref:Uncharacterized protein n=1 Tax=Kribbella italica TaxID=1540520 RepID=A0A7W9MSG8_9ACTN|nr:hypothetical protein [Kribbella italica]MBB5834554.1 hypothetical protein [Kribbella italica]
MRTQRSIGVLLACCLLMLLGVNTASAHPAEPVAPAPAAAVPEPHSYYMWCRSPTGLISYPKDPSECRGGNIKIISTYDGAVHGAIDMYALEHKLVRPYKTWTEAYRACTAEIICDLIVAVVQTYLLTKLSIAYKFLRTLL